ATTSVPTARAPRRASNSTICRRRGSAMALNTSAVVGARGMLLLYSLMGICQAKTRWRVCHVPRAVEVADGRRGLEGTLNLLAVLVLDFRLDRSILFTRARTGTPGAIQCPRRRETEPSY